MAKVSAKSKLLLEASIKTKAAGVTSSTSKQNGSIARQVSNDTEATQTTQASVLNFARDLENPANAENLARREEVTVAWNVKAAELAAT